MEKTAVEPRHTVWLASGLGVVLESLLVVLMCALASLSFNLLESRRATEADLREAAQRLDREVADRNRADSRLVAAL